MFTSTTALLALAGSVSAGSVLWDGRANAYTSSAFLDDWSFSNEVGPYQYYIHGTGNTSEYVKLDETYKNPADSGSKRGFQITIDNSSVWNSDNMLRTELIPQTTAAINKGKVYYHFSMQHTGTDVPSPYEEHQVCFFESHFTEMKYGLISGEQGTLDRALRWDVNSESQWNTTFSPNVWHNIAYEIDFDAGSVGFYHSTGGDDLKLTVSPVAVTASSNGADWHLGVLRLPSSTGRSDTGAEDWHFSGVYIESGSLTTSVSGPGESSSSSGASSSAVSVASSFAAPSTSAAAVKTSAKPTSIKAATTSAKPTTTVTAETKPATSSVAPTTLQTQVRSSSSSEIAPVSASSSSSAAVYSSVTQTSAASSAASTSVAISSAESLSAPVSVTTSAAITSVPSATAPPTQTSVSTRQPASHYQPQRHHHHKSSAASASSAVTPVSTSESDSDCVVNYVYV